MKRKLQLPLLALALVLIASTAFSQTARRITYECQYAASKPAIDGIEDAGWSSGNKGIMDQVVEGTAPTAADASGWFKVLWDKENLYFYINVTDDIRSEFDYNSTNIDPWMWDNVEIFIGVTNSDSTGYVSGDAQYRFHAGNADLYNPWDKTVNENVAVAYVDNTSDYIFEIQWPWSELYSGYATSSSLSTEELSTLLDEEIVTGKIIEFEIQFADNDDIGQSIRQNVIAWNNDTQDGNSWNNTDLWGHLQLIGTPTSIPSNDMEQTVKVYPTKVTTSVMIEAEKIHTIYVYNTLGQIEMVKQLDGASRYDLNMSELSKGMYILLIETEKGKAFNKVIK